MATEPDDLQYSIYVRERIERGRREADQGNLISQEDVEDRMKQFITSAKESRDRL
jgi:hypothetical protein